MSEKPLPGRPSCFCVGCGIELAEGHTTYVPAFGRYLNYCNLDCANKQISVGMLNLGGGS